MSRAKEMSSTAAFEHSLAEPGDRHYVLRLYVAGTTARSAIAISNIKKICDEQLKGLYELQVIDLYQQPELARGDQIIAVPTLIKSLPPPIQRIVGDLSDHDRVLIGLDLKVRKRWP
ncbi:MAG: circadian clock KaiB family protein [Spirochaetaceae bacterium]|nr:circadian clock KaiB family protein [Spirochaetaceae bacterium]